MDGNLSQPATLFLAAVGRLFKSRIALENAYLRQEVKILRGKLGKRVHLTETERAVLVRYGLLAGRSRLHRQARDPAGLAPAHEKI